MKIYLLTAKAPDRGFSDWVAALRRTSAGGTYADSWRVRSRQIEIGDEVYLLKQGDAPSGVVAHGRVTRGSYDHFKSRVGSSERSPRIDIDFDVVLGPGEAPLPWPLPNHGNPGKFRGPFASGVALEDELIADMPRQWAQHLKNQKQLSSQLSFPAACRLLSVL